MKHPRVPLSIEDALDRCAGHVGYQALAEITGKSTSTVRAWADPERDDMNVQLRHAEIIDRHVRDQAGETPLLTYFKAQLDQVEPPAVSESMRDLLLMSSVTLGRLAQGIMDARCPKSPGGSAITLNEAAACNDHLQDLRMLVNKIERLMGQESAPQLREVGGK